ncbi:hypothetical protein ABZ504_30990, partial [Streptomyces mirabilis]|uniref:hypothetical protein n=3 Tax=Streptomyces TaxID=1883 RepID=UPI0033F349D7
MTRTRLTYAHRPARELLRIAAAEAGAWFLGRISGVFALGSMAHGGFAPEVSDVDIALVFDEIPADAAERVTALAEHVRALVPAEARPLADRLSVFWSDWPHLCRGEGAGRLPAVDRADFLEHGVLLTGHDLRHLCPRPDDGELVVESAHFAARKFGAEPYLALLRSPRRLLAAGAREATRAVLVP